MNFRRIEIVGFKSFADRLEIVFEPGITAIVGPNGCGKSNVGDAIKWALGEQNAKALRCERMEDIIFNGGSNRRQLGMSQVSLTISSQAFLQESLSKEPEVSNQDFLQESLSKEPEVSNQDLLQESLSKEPEVSNQDFLQESLGKEPEVGNQDFRQGNLDEELWADNRDFPRESSGKEPEIIISGSNLPTEFSEIEIERRLFRSGESEYYINRNRCLLKDIQELFMDTGLGINSYSIMEQGHIDLILNSNPQDRRLIFEEAAGITKFRHRRRTAIKKLEATEQNILRINDILHELEQQVSSLKRQESRARTYQRYYNDLKSLDTILNRRRYVSESVKLNEVENSRASLDDQMQSVISSVTKLEAGLEGKRLEMANLDMRLGDIRSQERKVQSRIEEIESSIAVLKERRTNLQQQQQKASDEIARITERLEELESQIASINTEKDELASIIISQENELNIAQKSADNLTGSLAIAEKEIDDLKAQSIDALKEKSKVQNEISATDSRLDYLVTRIERLKSNAESFQSEKSQLEDTLARLEEDIGVKEDEIESLMADQNRMNSEIEQLRSSSAKLDKNIREIEQRRSARFSRLQSLEELQKAHEGYGAGVKALLKAYETRKEETLQGLCGAIAEIIRTQPQYELAIEASLGSSLQSIVTNTIEDARKAIQYLKERKSGRASFIFMDNVKGKDEGGRMKDEEETISSLILHPSSFFSHPFSIVPAYKVVEFDERYSTVINYILGRTVIVDSLDIAIELSKNGHAKGIQFATMDGQVLSGSTISGGTGSEGAGLLSRSREISELKKEVVAIDEQLNNLGRDRDDILKKLSSLQHDKDRLAKQIQSSQISHAGMQRDLSQYKQRLARLEKEISVIDTEHTSLSSEIAKLQDNKKTLLSKYQELEDKSIGINNTINELVTQMRSSLAERDSLVKICNDIRVQLASKKQQEKGLMERLNSLEKEKTRLSGTLSSYQTSATSDVEAEKDIADRISTEENLLEELFNDRTQIESQISDLESQRQKVYVELSQDEESIRNNRKELDQIKQEKYQTEVMKTQLQMNIDALISKMRERYGVSLTELQEEIQTEMSEEEIDNRIQDLRSKMERLGPVNLTAVDEYNRQKDRYDLMISQKEDLLKAKDSLYSIIQRINKESRERLRETFDSVNANFQWLFQRLFGGGHGELAMVGEEDPLESGIDIIARPPGKKPQAISMLSTGERALTAIALMFALFKIKPSPFCVMDEVDAALDDANVGRFTDMVREFAEDTQFVIITHNKRTMEIADILYGITMEESGVSKLVSLRMGSAKRVAAEMS